MQDLPNNPWKKFLCSAGFLFDSLVSFHIKKDKVKHTKTYMQDLPKSWKKVPMLLRLSLESLDSFQIKKDEIKHA